MNMLLLRSLILLLLVSISMRAACMAQPDSADARYYDSRYGVSGIIGGGLDLHSAPIRGLPDVPSCCPEYSTASAVMPLVDVMGHMRFTDVFRAEIRLGFDYHSAMLSTEQTQVIAPE
ncbi:MAG: hypothetical protein ACK475_09895, partial [Bacteroidota bacterium]